MQYLEQKIERPYTRETMTYIITSSLWILTGNRENTGHSSIRISDDDVIRHYITNLQKLHTTKH